MLKIESHLIVFTSYYKQQLRLLQLKDKEWNRDFLEFSQLILTSAVCSVTPEFYAAHLFNQESYLLKR